jgi:hypothetical protein
MPCLCDLYSEDSSRRTSCQLTRPAEQGPPRQQTRYPVGRRFLLAGRDSRPTTDDSDRYLGGGKLGVLNAINSDLCLPEIRSRA